MDSSGNTAANGNFSARTACCCVCMEVEDYNGSVLVQCAKCGVRVHIKCYGVSVTGVGGDMSTWHCQPCQYMMDTATGALKANTTSPPLLTPQCAVCPVAGGALRLTDQRDVWCHVLCINWIPELSHSMAGEMDEAVQIALLDRSRSSLRCLVCGLRGGCIQCVSGRCARAFHVVCAFRSPSSLIFTGYNNDNQQVYHCKTHLSDVSTHRYEMVDNSWRSLPEVQKFKRDHPSTDGKCRYCPTKLVPAAREGHEAQCVLTWLSRLDAQRRKEEVDRVGVKPVQIAYARKKAKSPSKGVGGKNRSKSSPIARKDRLDEDHQAGLSGDGLSSVRSGKQKRQPVPMRPCPECGESVRETLMMGHLKNSCPRSRHTDARGSKLKRKTQMPPRPISGDVFQDEVEVADLSDVLFASWPGQTSGGPMDSTYFWKVVTSHFFSSKVLAKKPMEQLCKSLCGMKLEDIAKSSRRRPLQSTDIHCRDTVRLERNTEDPRQPLVLQKVTHRCDFLMRASHSRCMSDSFAKPMLEIRHNPQRAEYADGVSYETILEDAKAEIRVLFTGMDNRLVNCKYTLCVSRNGTTMDQHKTDDGTVASSFEHDVISSLVGFDMQTKKLSLPKEDKLLISLDTCDQMDAVVDGSLPVEGLGGTARPELTDELTPAINLLMDHLKDQMEQNRYSLRTLSKKLQTKEHKEEQFQLQARTTELLYREFSSWKRLCASLLIGYKTASQGEEDAKTMKTEEQQARAAEAEDDDDAIDDGTCVVCFDGQSPETNPIVFCDRCELAVHQRCYGIAKVPSNEFICDRCRVEREGLDPVADVFCQLCSLGDGAFKRTVDGKWVHVVCALWCPKVWIGNLFELSEISLVGNANQTRFVDTVTEIETRITQATAAQPTSHKNGEASSHEQVQALQLGSLCMHCRVACGRTIQCCHSGCTASFHPLCGWFDGLPMTISLGDRGYMYAGGGAGLNFEMYCASHLPEHYPTSEKLSQRRRRSRFRIDSYFVIRNKANYSSGARKHGYSESSLLSGAIVQALITAENKRSATGDDDPQAADWADMAVCSACFEYCAPVVGELTDVNMLHRRQFMIRCQYCNVYIHPECCISDIGSSPTIFRSNWICEWCTQTGDKEAPECVVCAKSTDYLMPCVDPPAAPTPVALQAVPDARPLGLAIRPAPGGGQQLWLEAHQKMQRQQQQLQHQGEKSLPQNGQQLVQGSNGTATPPASSKWIHVYCSKWKKTKTLKRHHMLWAYPPASNTDGIATRCELCSRKDGTLASCAKCPRRFHPLCAAKKKLYCARSNRVEWKFYCEAHPPVDAAFDENRQSWITQETLSQLQDLRRSLERGRMLLEMSRQRDRQQKRLLNLCKLPLMKASIDVILKKRPSAQMKEVYFDLTGDTLTDAVARPKPTPPSPRTSGSRTRPKRSASSSSSMDQERRAPQRSSPRVAAAARPTRSSLKRSGTATATPERSSKRRRLRSDSDASTTTDSNVRRSSRRKSLRYSQTPSDDEDMGDGEENDSATEKVVLAARKRFLACLVVPRTPTDFDLVVPQQFPSLVGMRS